MNIKKIKMGLSIAGLILFLAGCGSNANTKAGGQGESEGAIVIQDFAGREVSLEKAPEKIVALGNGDVDIIYALKGEVVGRPTSAPSVRESENAEQVGSTHEINLEKIAVLQPDIILANSAMNLKDVPALESLGAKVALTEANSIADIKKQIVLYGEMLQKGEMADQVIKELESKLEKFKSSDAIQPRVLLVYGAPGTYMAALPNSLSGDILTQAGGRNIAEDYPALDKFPQYAQINTERVVEANPDYVLLMTHGNEEEVKKGFINEMKQNAAWNSINAVKDGNIEVLPADLFGTNPGTKVADAVMYLGEKLHLE
ncbi:iron complex transport system substrate-binding protein [Cytobacillus purgationiresistens]|uniref:Iron complex transport system substrate-binding protein n=2 Tax=Cytobacillus purgationiresistens TaxID=863449 RepID=A0ABU0AP28_9BACI|nr:iron complex transport system substrate-binding protein [Cytobacillus purgationiresistens]